MEATDALEVLLAALSGEFVTGHPDDSPTLVAQTGTLPTEDWCSGDRCWQVWVRLNTMVPSTRFPVANLDAPGYTAPLAAQWHVGVFRCIASMGEDGTPPPAVEQTADTALILDDAHRLYCAIKAAAARWPKDYTQLSNWNPMGPDGGCAGGYWIFTTSLLGALR